jgi:hypothetical protein
MKSTTEMSTEELKKEIDILSSKTDKMSMIRRAMLDNELSKRE